MKSVYVTIAIVIILPLCITLGVIAQEPEEHPEYLIGTYYYSGWWCEPLTQRNFYRVRDGKYQDWRKLYPEREPLVGWYDDSQKAMDAQIVQASDYGISVFIFDWYTDRVGPFTYTTVRNYNNGLKFFLTSPEKVRMKFAILYVNHEPFGISTREEWSTTVDQWIGYFKDPQYLKIDGKPVFFVLGSLYWMNENWNGSELAIIESLAELRQKTKAAGFPDLLLGAGESNPGNYTSQLKKYGYDFLTAYGSVPFQGGQTDLLGIVQPYDNLIDHHRSQYFGFSAMKFPVVPYITSGWDPRPWYGPDAEYFEGRSSERFRESLLTVKEFLDASPNMRVPTENGRGQKMVVIYAWNELGEGGYIIPTKGDEYSMLEQIKDVFLEQ